MFKVLLSLTTNKIIKTIHDKDIKKTEEFQVNINQNKLNIKKY